MAEIVNLTRTRKAKARVTKDAQAAQHRLKFGRTKAEKQAETSRAALAARKLDGHKRDK